MARKIQEYYPELKIADKFEHKYALSLAVTNSNPILLGIFNKVIATISVQQHQEILNRWLPLVYEKESDLIWFWYLSALVIFIFSIFIIRYVYLLKANQKLTNMQEKLEQLSMRDTLTGLPSRYYFTELLDKEWARSRQSMLPLSVVIIDIDHFKHFNDQYGRLAGDSCLVELARRLQLLITRPADLVARYGGEEFALILPETDENGVNVIVAEIFNLLKQWSLTHKGSVYSNQLTISAGSATLVFNEQYKADELIRRADNALFQAQQKGHNQSVLYGHNN